jgi:hypothetical protein
LSDDATAHLRDVIEDLRDGCVVPFLGAGANMAGRAEGAVFDPASGRDLPTGSELARYLAKRHGYEQPDFDNLVRVAEYIALVRGEGRLYLSLRQLFDRDYPTTPLHDLLARLPRLMRERGWQPLQLIVTTNYDDLLERAFQAQGEEYDVITYMALGKDVGHFLHFPPKGEPRLIAEGTANTYLLDQDDSGNLVRPAILKLHGAVDRLERDRDSFVITETHYIEYVARSDVHALIPAPLLEKLKYSSFLFLGYSLRDWNVRAILHQIWSLQRAGFKSWAIQHTPDPFETRAWESRGVDILAIDLVQYVAALASGLEENPAPSAVANS